jgi:hypothetical protein
MQLRADALRFVLAQGLPAVIEVSGRSMEPTIAKGAKVNVAALAEADGLEVGDVVLVEAGGGLLLHRVMAAFDDRGVRFIIHQGDAHDSTFGISARRYVLARMTGPAGASGEPPTPGRLDAAARALFRRRRLACEGFVVARRLVSGLPLSDGEVVRRCAQVYRRLARAIVG